MKKPIFSLNLNHQQDVGAVPERTQELAGLLGFASADQTRLAIAIAEVARQALKRMSRGTIEFWLEGQTAPQVLLIRIAGQTLNTTAGSASLSEELSTSLAMARRSLDQVELKIRPNGETKVELIKLLPHKTSLITSEQLQQITNQLAEQKPQNSAAGQPQTHEFSPTLAELRLRQAEATLEAQRAFLRQVIDLNPNFIFAKDRAGRFTLANLAVAELYGTTVANLLGKTDADFNPNPAEIEHFQQDDLAVIDSQQEKFIPEESITTADGQTMWLQTVKRPIVDEDGVARQVLGVATDITTHKTAQTALVQLNETLEQRVSERTALLQLLQDIAAAANEAETVEGVLEYVLERVCTYTGWPVGHVYWVNRENPHELISSNIWHLDEPEQYQAFQQISAATTFTPGVGLPGQVWANGRVAWIMDISHEPNFPRKQVAIENGLQAGFGFPLWVGQEIVAVLEFFSPRAVEPDGAFLEAVTQIGTQLGRVVERRRAERRIRESEQQLLEAQRIAHVGSWHWDIVANHVTWSDELYRIYGLEPQSAVITYEGFLERVHPDDRQRVAEIISTAYRTGQSFDYEHRLIRPDGLVRTLHAQGRVIVDTAGQPRQMFGATHDITERKEIEEQLRRLNIELEQRVLERTAQLEAANQELAEEVSERQQAEAALQDSETQLRLITDAIPALVAYVDAEHRYLFNNRAYETWFGHATDEMTGRRVEEVLGQAAYESVRPYLEAALAGQEVSYEQGIPYQSGGTRYIQAHYMPDIAGDGQIRGYVSLVHDITERRQIEEALRESETRFRVMADTAPVLIWMSNAAKQYYYFNQPWLDFTGRTLAQEEGFGWTEGVHPNDYQRCLEIYTTAFEARQPFEMEYRLRRADGEYRWIVNEAVPRFEGEQFVGYIGSCLDIHERKRAELAERLLAETGKLNHSLNPAAQLANIAWLAVPDLADWCAVDLYEEDWVVHHVAVAHIDPAKLELAEDLRRRYPSRREELLKGVHPWQRGQSELYPEISDALLEAGAQDAEHYQLLQSLNLRSAMVVPLVGRERVLGIIAFFWAESGNRYDEQDLALAEELAHRAAIALENAHAYEAEQQARQIAEETMERIASLQDITTALSGAVTPTQVAQVIIEKGLAVVGAAGGVVTHLNEAGTEHEILYFQGYSTEAMKKWGRRFSASTPSPLTEAAQTGQPVFVESVDKLMEQYANLSERRVSNGQAFAALPLRLEDRTIGAIGLSFAEAQVFSADEQAFMLTLAGQCAQALERARLYEVEQQARLEAETNQQHLILLAEMRERDRLAQELHDTVAQALGYLNLKIGLTSTLLTSDRTEGAIANLQELKQVISETYTDVREEIFNLRAKVLSGLSFMEMLGRYIDKYHRFYKLNIELVQEADPSLFDFPPQVASQLIRIIQEALINVRKHARVEKALIRLGQEDGFIRIIIEDQGQGFDPAQAPEKSSSFGLQIMRDRVESVGGTLSVETAPGQGTRIILLYQK